MKRVLLDQGLPRSAARILVQHGWDAQHVGEIGMSQAEDIAILDLARHQNRVVITLDADFHALLAVSGQAHPSVIRIRQEGLKGESIAALVETIFASAGSQLDSGALVTVANGNLRIKLLPIAEKERP